jgi:hypothetical protein
VPVPCLKQAACPGLKEKSFHFFILSKTLQLMGRKYGSTVKARLHRFDVLYLFGGVCGKSPSDAAGI